ncbi:MAG: efflux RND transporter periplasmic adaptor subunit [Bacteroidota bacterium]
MDKKIEKKKGIKRKHIYIAGGVLLAILVIYQMIYAKNISSYKVDSDKITIEEVSKGTYHNYITVTGNVEPIAKIYLDVREGGRVEEKFIEEGEHVKKGDIILKLSNPDLNMSILNSEAQLAEKSNFLRNTMVTLEQEKLQIKKELLNLEFDIKKKKRTYDQNKTLFDEKLISEEDFLVSKENYEFAKKSFDLYKERQKQDSIYRNIQVKQMKSNLENMRLNLELIHKRQEYLNVKSPVDGQLTILDAEIGQSVPKGGRLGQIQVLTSYKVVADIDEHYIDKVKEGLTAIMDRQGQEFKLKIRKVFPDVRNGRFLVEMIFTDEKPKNMRTGQTYYTRLQLGNPKESLLLPRGSFFQETGGQWIYVVSEDGKAAHKRTIKIGSQNPKYYELIEGLEAGQKVVTSSYALFGDNDMLILE